MSCQIEKVLFSVERDAEIRLSGAKETACCLNQHRMDIVVTNG
jgi:hypothetical protein